MNKTILTVIFIGGVGLLLLSALRGNGGAGGTDWKNKIVWVDPATSEMDIARAAKPIFLFVHTEWCTYCKKMKGEAFADHNIQKIMNDRFTNIIMNPETDCVVRFMGVEQSAADLAKKLGVDGYPALFFFTAEGKLIARQPGYLPVSDFAALAQYIGSGYYQKMSFEKYRALPLEDKKQAYGG
jgi:thioredoxin-related protein